jgi:hypothetical protein
MLPTHSSAARIRRLIVVEVTQAEKAAANKAFDIAFRGDTEGIDEAMAALFAAHAARERIEAAKAMQEAAVKAVQDNLAFSIKVTIIKAIRALDPVKIAGGE